MQYYYRKCNLKDTESSFQYQENREDYNHYKLIHQSKKDSFNELMNMKYKFHFLDIFPIHKKYKMYSKNMRDRDIEYSCWKSQYNSQKHMRDKKY